MKPNQWHDHEIDPQSACDVIKIERRKVDGLVEKSSTKARKRALGLVCDS